jgi:hypothetical protein
MTTQKEQLKEEYELLKELYGINNLAKYTYTLIT